MPVGLRSNRNVVYQCRYHVVFCPKYRRAVLDPPIQRRMEEIVAEVCAERDADLDELEVVPDHVHLLIGPDPQFGVHRLVKQIKGRSSRLLRSEFPTLSSRLPSLWTNSYFVATVGGAPLDVVKRYIEEQKGR